MSVSPAEKRIERFKAKVDPDVISSVISAQRDGMIAKQAARFAEIADYQAFVKKLLAQNGIIAELTVAFMKIAGRLYSLVRNHEMETAVNEATHYLNMTYCKYKNVFASTEKVTKVLTSIASYFGITWTPPTTCYE